VSNQTLKIEKNTWIFSDFATGGRFDMKIIDEAGFLRHSTKTKALASRFRGNRGVGDGCVKVLKVETKIKRPHKEALLNTCVQIHLT